MAVRLLCLLILLVAVSPALADASLVLPVTGEWLAIAGPPCPAAGDIDCRTSNTSLGFELAPLDAFGRPAATCLNQPVLAPGAGTVVEVLDAYPNAPEPGQHRFGNHIVIEHGPSEFIVLGSLARHSIRVAVGDRVLPGETVAACGFSGSGGRSALHVHMQAGRDILDTDSAGLPMPFSDLSVRTPGGCMPTTLLYRGQGTCADGGQ